MYVIESDVIRIESDVIDKWCESVCDKCIRCTLLTALISLSLKCFAMSCVWNSNEIIDLRKWKWHPAMKVQNWDYKVLEVLLRATCIFIQFASSSPCPSIKIFLYSYKKFIFN